MASGENVSYDLPLIRKALQRNYVVLTDHLKATEFLPELFSQGVITLETKQELDCVLEKSGSIKFCRALVDQLLQKSTPDGDLEKAITILSIKQPAIYENVIEWIGELQTCSNLDEIGDMTITSRTDNELDQSIQSKLTDLKQQLALKEDEISRMKLDLDHKDSLIQSLKRRVGQLECQEKASKQTNISQIERPKMTKTHGMFDFKNELEDGLRYIANQMVAKNKKWKNYQMKMNYDEIHWQYETLYQNVDVTTNMNILKSNVYVNSSDMPFNNSLKDQTVDTITKIQIEFETSRFWLDEEVSLPLPLALSERCVLPSKLAVCPGQDFEEERVQVLSAGALTLEIPARKKVKVEVRSQEEIWSCVFCTKLTASGVVTAEVLSPEGKLQSMVSMNVVEAMKSHRCQVTKMHVGDEKVQFDFFGKLRASYYTDLLTNVEECSFE